MITKEQRELRRKMLGSSDAPAVMGVDPYQSASDIWLTKTGQVDDAKETDAMARGNLFEPMLIQYAIRELVHGDNPGWESPDTIYDASGLLCANLDARLNPSEIIEAKSTVIEDGWGEVGTDQVPARVTVQVHHQFYVCGPAVRIAWVPVVLPGYRSFDFRLYRVDRDDELADHIGKSGIAFMRDFVQARRIPDDYKPSLEILKRVRREPNKTVEIDPELLEDWIVAKAQEKSMKESTEEAQAAILAAMGDAEAGRCADGRIVTYMQTARKGYTVEPTTYRSLKLASKAKQLTAANTAKGE